jgi:hypothetical protein
LIELLSTVSVPFIKKEVGITSLSLVYSSNPGAIFLWQRKIALNPKNVMEQSSSAVDLKSKHQLRIILLSGLLIGLMDGTAAVVSSYVTRGVTPAGVFRYVASGVFGKDAFTGGLPMAAAGLLFHFIIAMGWTVLFFLLYPRLRFLSWNKFIIGILYGLFVWLAMQAIVLPLSNVPNSGFPNLSQAYVGILIHMFIVGVPISLLAHRYYRH